jgi:hypothetical protein
MHRRFVRHLAEPCIAIGFSAFVQSYDILFPRSAYAPPGEDGQLPKGTSPLRQRISFTPFCQARAGPSFELGEFAHLSSGAHGVNDFRY